MRKNRYEQILDYLYRQLPMFQRIGPAAFKKDLTNTLALCRFLGNPQERFPSIHIAGTNGKGSTTHMLGAILQAMGLRVGLYISPHYRDFRERIKINGQYISRAEVIDFVERCKPLTEEIKPSFFELTVAMAFEHFARHKVDVAVIETGLGGRLDSTNVIQPLLSVITNISFDHVQFLGNTLPLIAGEKAGIIKPGVPVVIGETQKDTLEVFRRKAGETASTIVFADQHYEAKLLEEDFSHSVFDIFREGQLKYSRLELGVGGPFQDKNLQTVLQAVEQLQQHFPIQESHLRKGLLHLREFTRFIGRWQVIGENPTILCDSAHNEGGLAIVMERLKNLSYQRLHLVIGAVNDKDLGKMLALMPKNGRYYFARPDLPRGLDAYDLRRQAAEHDLVGRPYSSVPNALKAARRAAAPDDLIFVGGSTFVVAEVIGDGP